MQLRVPVWLVKDSTAVLTTAHADDRELYPHLDDGQFKSRFPIFRGVAPDHLLRVLTHGVDVEPTDAPIYCGDFGKAWEYGGTSGGRGPRLIMALDQRQLLPSFHVLSSGASPEDIAAIRETYPYHHSEHPNALYFSRNNTYFPGYEVPYGFWIPGTAGDALMAIFLVGDDAFWRQRIHTIRVAVLKVTEEVSGQA